jgi:hypothetical protein
MPGRTALLAPIVAAPLQPPLPAITTHLMWKHVITPSLDESTFTQFADTFDTHVLTHSSSNDTPPDLRVAYLNIRTLTTDKHFFLSALIVRYRLDVLILTDTRVSNVDQSKYTLRACLGKGYTILHSPPILRSPGGQTIIIAPSWSGAYQSMWNDPTGLGFLTEITLRSGQQNVKLFGTYWPCANPAEHSFETTLTSQLPRSAHYTDWRSFFEYTLLERLHHD